MKLKNGEIKAALDGLNELVGGTNRLGSVAAATAAYRNRRRLLEAWEIPDKVRSDLVEEHGTPREEGGYQIRPGDGGWDAFVAACDELGAEEQEIEVEVIPWAAVEAGYSKEPGTGKRGPLDVSAPSLGLLQELGFIGEPSMQ